MIMMPIKVLKKILSHVKHPLLPDEEIWEYPELEQTDSVVQCCKV